MMLAAPEFVIPEPVELLDEVEIAAELQQRMLAHGVMRGKKGAELQAGHIRTPFVAAATGNWRTSYQNSSLRFLQLQRRVGYYMVKEKRSKLSTRHTQECFIAM